MARKWNKWDREEYDRIERLVLEGLTYAEIAEAMNKTLGQVLGVAQRLGLQREDRLGWRRLDWDTLDPIITDCIEARLMTLPQVRQHLGALGHQVAMGTLYNRVKTYPYHVRQRAKANGASRKAACCTRMRKRQQSQRRTAA